MICEAKPLAAKHSGYDVDVISFLKSLSLTNLEQDFKSGIDNTTIYNESYRIQNCPRKSNRSYLTFHHADET
jgi:hypothetical protein